MLFLEFAQQRHDLFLHGTVQRRCRLIEQNQCGFQHQRPGNGDALTLATGKFMGVAMPTLRVDADFFQRPNDLCIAFRRVVLAVHLQPLTDDLRHRHARAEAAVRVLKDHLHLFTPRAHLFLTQAVQRLPAKADTAA